MFARIGKAAVLLILAISIGFLFGLLRPRRVVSRFDLHDGTPQTSQGGGGGDTSGE